MNNNSADKTLDQLLEPGSTLMVGTKSASGEFEFRPLTVARVRDSRIEILLDANEEWVRAFSDGDVMLVTLSDNRSNSWMSMRGHGSTTTDPALVDELWNPFAGAYFDQGRDTPGIAVLIVDGENGRYWSTPSGRLGAVMSMVKAKLGSAEDSGDSGSVAL